MSDHTIEFVATVLFGGAAAIAVGYAVGLAIGVVTDIVNWWKGKP